MSRVALIALAIAGCAGSSSRPPPPAPIENRARPTPTAEQDTCARDLSWLAEARYLRYSRFEHGHFGEWRFHADFYRLSEGAMFHGVVIAAYRQHDAAPIKASNTPLALPTTEVTKLLTSLRDHIRTPGAMTEGQVVVSDSSRSVVIAIEAMAFDPRVGWHPNFYVQFFVDDGETEPQGWNVRGCSYQQSLEIRRTVQALTDAFAKRLGNDAMLDKLMQP